jgi:hypothetical protein
MLNNSERRLGRPRHKPPSSPYARPPSPWGRCRPFAIRYPFPSLLGHPRRRPAGRLALGEAHALTTRRTGGETEYNENVRSSYVDAAVGQSRTEAPALFSACGGNGTHGCVGSSFAALLSLSRLALGWAWYISFPSASTYSGPVRVSPKAAVCREAANHRDPSATRPSWIGQLSSHKGEMC